MDNKEDVIKSLVALAAEPSEKSEIAKLRDFIEYIELALASGKSRERVLETLNATLGIKMNLKTFENSLHRIRKKRKATFLQETPKTPAQTNTGLQQLMVIPNTLPANTPTQQNELEVIDEKDNENKEGNNADLPMSLKEAMNTRPDMDLLTTIGLELYKKQRIKKHESSRD